MAKGWTEERRRAAAERCRKNKPWEKSTGPRTARGKKRSSMNAYKHGARCRVFDQYRTLLRLNHEFLKQYQLILAADMDTISRTNELIKTRKESSRIKGMTPGVHINSPNKLKGKII